MLQAWNKPEEVFRFKVKDGVLLYEDDEVLDVYDAQTIENCKVSVNEAKKAMMGASNNITNIENLIKSYNPKKHKPAILIKAVKKYTRILNDNVSDINRASNYITKSISRLKTITQISSTVKKNILKVLKNV